MKLKTNYLIIGVGLIVMLSMLSYLFYIDKQRQLKVAQDLSPIAAQAYINDYLLRTYNWRGDVNVLFSIEPIVKECKLTTSAIKLDNDKGAFVLANSKYNVDFKGIQGCYDKEIQTVLDNPKQAFTPQQLQLFSVFNEPQIVNMPKFSSTLNEIKADQKVYPIEFLTLTKLYAQLYENALNQSFFNTQPQASIQNNQQQPVQQPVKAKTPASDNL